MAGILSLIYDVLAFVTLYDHMPLLSPSLHKLAPWLSALVAVATAVVPTEGAAAVIDI